MSVPKEKGVVVPTELTVVAHKMLEEQVQADLQVPDPSPEVAEAVLSESEEEKSEDGTPA